jgi:hypothetical protein
MALSYSAGDRIRIFEAHGGYCTGEVIKVTPSGQIIAKAHGRERRFTPAGREVGQGGYHAPYIMNKEQGEARAADLSREAKRRLLRRQFRDHLDALGRKDPTDQREAVLAELQALIDFVKEAP